MLCAKTGKGNKTIQAKTLNAFTDIIDIVRQE